MGVDAVTLEVLRNALVGVAEEMNANLVRTGYSPNIKERRDCSAALFDARGRLIAPTWRQVIRSSSTTPSPVGLIMPTSAGERRGASRGTRPRSIRRGSGSRR